MRMRQSLAGGDLSGARAHAERAHASHPGSAQAAVLHGTLCLQQGDPAAAAPSFGAALRLEPSNWRAAANHAAALLQLEGGRAAVAPARAAAALEPTAIVSHVLLASALRAAGELRAAQAAAREAVRLEAAGAPQPSDATCGEPPRIVLGEVLVESGELQEAWALALQMAEASAHAGPQMALACTLAGRVQLANRQYEGALDAFEKASKLDPPNKARPTRLRTAMVTQALRACLPAKAGDVFIATFPKSGTTWMQQVVCMLSGEPAEVDLQMRAPYVEAALATCVFSLPRLRRLPSPRIFKTHAAWAELPLAGCSGATTLPPGAKVVVVVRDPRDVMVSLYYHSRSIKGISYEGSWDEWFDEFLAGTAPLPMAASSGGGGGGGGGGSGGGGSSNDWFEHTVGWWRVAQASPDGVLWVRYEALLRDPMAEVRRVARFVAPAVANDEARLRLIVSASSFGEMKQRHESDPENEALRNAGEHGHFRKGQAGDWRNHMSEAQAARFETVLRSRLEGTGLEGAFDG